MQEWFLRCRASRAGGYGLTLADLRSHLVNNPRATRFGTVGPPVPWFGGQDRRRWRDFDQGPGRRCAWLPQHAGGNRGERSRTAGSRPETLAKLDELGYLKITDRKKDLIKTSGGKYVAPQKVEGVLKVALPLFSQVLVYGGRKCATALLTLDPESIEGWAEEQGLSYSSAEVAPLQEVHMTSSGVRRAGQPAARALGDDQGVRDPAQQSSPSDEGESARA